MTGKVQAATNAQETIRIGGVKFLKEEVLGIAKKNDECGSVFTVQTTFGRFEYNNYNTEAGHYRNPNNKSEPSIMAGNLNNVHVDTYTGTKNQDVLHLSDSVIMEAKLKGDPDNQDIIYCDWDSWVNQECSGTEYDNEDQIWKQIL